jgi:hypothetical protein
MKLRWLPILFAAFLLAAPTVSADDGSVADALQNLIDQIAAILTGDEPAESTPGDSALNDDFPEHVAIYPPSG